VQLISRQDVQWRISCTDDLQSSVAAVAAAPDDDDDDMEANFVYSINDCERQQTLYLSYV